MDCNLPGSSIHGIFQARILERVATSFSGIREGLPLPKSGIKPTSPIWQVDSLPLTHQGSPINHMFFHNSKVNKLQRLEITPNIIFEHRRLNYKSKNKKINSFQTNVWTFISIFIYNSAAAAGIKKVVK